MHINMELPYEIPYYSHIFGKYAYNMHIEFIFVASALYLLGRYKDRESDTPDRYAAVGEKRAP